MYVIFDNTVTTMTDLIGFEEYLNETTPFNIHEYNYVWKTEERYHDFAPGNEWNASCRWPRIWGQDGFPLAQDIKDQMVGCKNSEFDQVTKTFFLSGSRPL
jgi:alpha-1,3-glucan synthase